jgi:hypothetical protein
MSLRQGWGSWSDGDKLGDPERTGQGPGLTCPMVQVSAKNSFRQYLQSTNAGISSKSGLCLLRNIYRGYASPSTTTALLAATPYDNTLIYLHWLSFLRCHTFSAWRRVGVRTVHALYSHFDMTSAPVSRSNWLWICCCWQNMLSVRPCYWNYPYRFY